MSDNPIVNAFAVLTEAVEVIAGETITLAKSVVIMAHDSGMEQEKKEIVMRMCINAEQVIDHVRLGLNEARMTLEVEE